jgi:hypothetical protein
MFIARLSSFPPGREFWTIPTESDVPPQPNVGDRILAAGARLLPHPGLRHSPPGSQFLRGQDFVEGTAVARFVLQMISRCFHGCALSQLRGKTDRETVGQPDHRNKPSRSNCSCCDRSCAASLGSPSGALWTSTSSSFSSINLFTCRAAFRNSGLTTRHLPAN